MSVKEFCLVPRSQVETRLPAYQPRTQVQPALAPQQTNTLQHVSSTPVKDDPALDETIKILLRPTEHEYADGILSYLRKHPLIRWDSSGNMMSPIRDVNIIDIIRYWVNTNANFDASKIPDLRMMIKLVDLPKSYIRNPKARARLFKGGGHPPSKVKPGKIRWEPY